MSKAPPVGIDLGTTYSCVAVYQITGGQETVEVIPNEQGTKTSPSIVAFTDDEGCIVGEAARNQMSSNPTNTVYDAKRMIGRPYDDEVLQKDMKHWPFKVVNEDGRPKVEVEYQEEMKTFFPEEISSRVLIKLKQCAEEFLGKPVEDAVVTVPAYFSEKQRETTRHAASIAGLNVLSIINEPTAAAIAYGFEKKITGQRTVLVYDLGGGTFDVTLLKIKENDYEVIATGGDNHLGGLDFDNNMVDYFLTDILQKKNVDLKDNKSAMSKLRERCEMAKREISSPGQSRSTVLVDNLYDGKSYKGLMTRSRFNEMNDVLFKSTLEPLKQVLEDAKIDVKDIDDVVLAGGSTKIPQVRSLLDEFFGNKPIASINPDEIVAKGAAIRAASFESKQKNYARLKSFTIQDVCSLSLGVGSHGDIMNVIIPRNTKLPASGSETFTTTKHNQTSVFFPVYEGERINCCGNTMVAEFKLNEIPPLPLGEATIDVTFDLNEEGILKVSAKDRASGKETSLVKEKGSLPEADVQRLLADAERFMEEDRIFRDNVEAMVDLDRYSTDALYRVENSNSIGATNRRKVVDLCNDAVDWMENNRLADKSEFENCLRDLKKACDPLLENV